MAPREIWNEIERVFIPDNLPRRDEALSDQERDEMDEWRCRTFSAVLKLPPEKIEELIARLRYINEDIPESLKSKFSQ
jgi:hypothetical protein